jgi:hypothetical protein
MFARMCASSPQRAGRLRQRAQVCRSVRDVCANGRKFAAACGTFAPTGASLPQRAGRLRQRAQVCRSVRDVCANARKFAAACGTFARTRASMLRSGKTFAPTRASMLRSGGRLRERAQVCSAAGDVCANARNK